MSFINTNEDLRSVKTKKALYTAMFSLLKHNSFKKITIKRICEEALISRAAFYAHFIDKYDLLQHWMTNWLEDINDCNTYEQMEKVINGHLYENISILENLVYEADYETFDILFKYLLSTANLSTEKNRNMDTYSKNVVLSNFYAGGIISYVLWQIGNKFPSDVPLMNRHLFKMINKFQGRSQEEFLR